MDSYRYYKEQGFSLLEVVLAMAIISVAMVPITQNLAGSVKIGSDGNILARQSYLAQAKMEEILAQDFNLMSDANGSQILGVSIPWQVSISAYDADGDSTPDPDLKHVLLQAGEIRLETLRVKMPSQGADGL
ncbi:MAG: prepilin-type N-terminal cleavage/methylation domain-containing protein [bacterium]